MSLFRWPKREPWGGANVGDRRVVTRILILPKCLSGEWRWLGVERVVQSHDRWLDYDVLTAHPISVRGWRDVGWADAEEAA